MLYIYRTRTGGALRRPLFYLRLPFGFTRLSSYHRRSHESSQCKSPKARTLPDVQARPLRQCPDHAKPCPSDSRPKADQDHRRAAHREDWQREARVLPSNEQRAKGALVRT